MGGPSGLTITGRLLGILRNADYGIYFSDGCTGPLRNYSYTLLPCSRVCGTYSVTITINNSNAAIGATGGTTIGNGPTLNVGNNELNFLDTTRQGRLSLMGHILSNSCDVRREVLLGTAIDRGNVLHRRERYLGSTIISENSFTELVSISVYSSNERVLAIHTSNVVISAPANSATCSLTTNNPVLDPSLGYFIIASVYPRSLVSEDLIMGSGGALSVAIVDSIRGGTVLAYSNRGPVIIGNGSGVSVSLSPCVTQLVGVGPSGFCRAIGGGVVREKTWVRGGAAYGGA